MTRLFRALWLRLTAWYARKRYGAFLTDGSFKLDLDFPLVAPPITIEMKNRGTAWRLLDGQWREVCDFCGGNCGQCGMTERIGNVPFDFDRIIDNSGMRKGLPSRESVAAGIDRLSKLLD